jgi:hyperosmotically inducible protein
MDDQIRRAVYRTIFGEPGLSRYAESAVPSIHIIVKNGNVTLVGVVDSEADKNLINVRVNGIPNIFSVKNELVVTPSK